LKGLKNYHMMMRKVDYAEDNDYYIFSNNNKFSKKYYTLRFAIKLSKRLKNCYSCIDCINCKNCYNCIDCIRCIDCNNCSRCYYCKDIQLAIESRDSKLNKEYELCL
jgi:hypothetical protein